MKKFLKNVKNFITRTLGKVWHGFTSVTKFLWKHKFMTLFISTFGVAAAILLVNILTGSLASALIVEALSTGLIIGAVESLIFGAILLREKLLQRKELKLAKKLDESNAKNELNKTLTEDQKYGLLKQLANVRYKLAKATVKRTGKPMSLFEGVKFTASPKEKNISQKYTFLKRKADLFKIRGIESGYYQFRYEFLRDHRLKRTEKEYLNAVSNMPTPPFHWCKSIKSPIDGIDELSIEKTQINCHREATYLGFKSYAKNDYLTHARENYIKISYATDSGVIPSEARFNDKTYNMPTSKLLLNEAVELAKEYGDAIFPLTYTVITSNKKGKNIKIENLEQLNNFITSLEELEKSNKNTQTV